MADFSHPYELLEAEKKKFISQFKRASTTSDELQFWAKTEKLREQFDKPVFGDLYNDSELENPFALIEAPVKKLLANFKTEATTNEELNFWIEIEKIRGDHGRQGSRKDSGDHLIVLDVEHPFSFIEAETRMAISDFKRVSTTAAELEYLIEIEEMRDYRKPGQKEHQLIDEVIDDLDGIGKQMDSILLKQDDKEETKMITQDITQRIVVKDIFGITIRSAREEENEQKQIQQYMSDLIDEAVIEFDKELWRTLEAKIQSLSITADNMSINSSTEKCSISCTSSSNHEVGTLVLQSPFEKIITTNSAITHGLRYIYRGPHSVDNVRQEEKPTWIAEALKRQTELTLLQNNEKEIIEKDRQDKKTVIHNLFNNAYEKTKTKEKKDKKKKIDGSHHVKKSVFLEFMGSLFSCFHRPKKVTK